MPRVHGGCPRQRHLRLKPDGRDRRLKPRAGAFVPVLCQARRVSGLFRHDMAHPDDARAMAQILP
jgi:hypothetical protein